MQEQFYENLIREIPVAYAYHKMIYDESGKPIDYEFLDVNEAFEKMTSLSSSQIIGKRVTEVIPTIIEDSFNWIEEYGKIAQSQISNEF
ncbi:MAG: PAS domain-containing protein, partial [Clostridia bacterium]|nr:PAS domain-containing protein [Clostridia bacterium]